MLSPVVLNRNGLEVLSPAECRRLLSTTRVGRVGLSLGALPVVLPVNFAVMDGDVVIRTGPGTKLDAALAGSVVAFEADADDGSETAWSVMVQGIATVIDDAADLARARELGLRPWVGGTDDRFVRISTEVLTGRRLHHPVALAAAAGNGRQRPHVATIRDLWPYH